MADPNSEPPFFEGTSPKECEVFVATIRRRAFDQGKNRDNEWMAGLASTCFVGDALYWYEELEEDVQNDWSRLRPALLARFGRGGVPSTSAPSLSMTSTITPSTTIPTPAAAPPTVVPPSFRKGYLKVVSSKGSLHGYIAKRLDEYDSYTGLTRSVSDALLVSFPISSAGEVFEIQIINTTQSPQTSDTLAITWTNISGNQWMDMHFYARCCSFLTVASKQNWAVERKAWKISKEGELSVAYPKPDGGAEMLQCFVPSGILFRRFIPSQTYLGRIIFEGVV